MLIFDIQVINLQYLVQEWKLMPGKHYTLRYRVFSYDGEMTRERADRLWNDFAYPPKVTIKK